MTAEAAAVRPWKPPVSATTVSRPGRARKASRRAFSFASAPLLTKNARSSPSGAKSTSASPAAARSGLGIAVVWKKRRVAVSSRQRRIAGWR